VVRLLLVIALAAGCYHPKLVDCTVICGPGNSCPSSMTCQDGLCASPRPELLICPTGTTRQLAVGGAHACLVRYDHTAACWGANASGQLGDASTTDRSAPVFAGGFADWQSLAAGDSHTCGLRSDGSAWCWGDNAAGQLGVGDLTPRTSPAPVLGAPGWLTLSAATTRTCGTRTDGTVWCWGDGLVSPSPFPGSGELVQIGESGLLCTLDADRVIQCNGAPIGPGDWETLTVGAAHGCAVDQGGSVSCWGDDSDGQLGDGTMMSSEAPVPVGSGYTQVSCGRAHSCALATNGAISCWGNNDDGQLGDGTTQSHGRPAPVGGDTDWLMVRTGAHSSCGIHAEGTVQCWGNNDHGQVGDGTTSPRPTPTDVLF
jgi:alpha-tubulin suppressor-like RCC1 family protein